MPVKTSTAGTALAAVLLLSAVPGLAAPVRTTAGALTLGFDDAGRVTQVRIGKRSALLARAVAGSGFALKELGRTPEFVPLRGQVTRQGKALHFAAQHDGLTLAATMRPVPDGWEIAGKLRRTGPERCLSLRFGLPVNLEGWRLWQDMARSRRLRLEADATNAVETGLGDGFLDPLPFTAVSSDAVALAYATRLDEPRFGHVAYRARSGLFGITLDVALVDGQRFFAQEVPFRFYLLAPAGPWGVRAVVQRYFTLFPEWGQAPDMPPGGWMAWGDILRHDPPSSDFGLVYHEVGNIESTWKTNHLLGLVNLPYIEPSMYQQYHGDQERAPTPAEAYARLRHNAQSLETAIIPTGRDRSFQEWTHTLSKAILKTPVMAEDGEPVAPVAGSWPWIGDRNFGAQFPLCLLPGIPGGVGEARLDECRKLLAAHPADGMYLDCYGAHGGVPDFNRDSVNASAIPPTFGPGGKPAIAVWSSLFQWTEKLRAELGPDRACILPNIQTFNHPNPWHVIPVLGNEDDKDVTDRLLPQLRMVGYHKVVTQLLYGTYDDAFLKRHLLYAVFPGGIGAKESAPAGMRASYRKLVPCLRVLHRLGWQPVTQARSLQRNVRIERYGQAPGPVLLVVVNLGERRVVEVQVPLAAVPGGPQAWCRDPLAETPPRWRRQGRTLVLSVALASGETALLALGDAKAQAALDRLFAADRMDDLKLCFREHAVRQGTPHPLVAQAEALPAKAPAETITRLRALADGLSGEDPLTQRMRELADLAAQHLAASLRPRPPRPGPVVVPDDAPYPLLPLPWTEEFDGTAPSPLWEVNAGQGRVEVADGKVCLELKESTGVGLVTRGLIDFGARPVVLEARFTHHGTPHEWYVGTFLNLIPPVAMGDYLSVRTDQGSSLRMENGDTAASGFRKVLFDYQPIAPNVPHQLRLYLDAERYRLEIDGKLYGEGLHNLQFTCGRLSLSIGSGHQGHGDVWAIDSVQVRPAAPL